MVLSEVDKKAFGEAINKKLQELKDDLSTNDGWTFLKEEGGMKSYITDVPNDPNKKVKGGGPIKTNMSPADFMAWLDEKNGDPVKRKDYDPSMIYREIIEEIEPNWVVLHVGLDSGSMMVSNRESLCQMRTYIDDKVAYRVTESCDHESFPKVMGGFVRLNAKLSGWYAEKKNEGELELWYVNHSDPAGYVPAWLANKRLGQAALSALVCKKMIEEE
ncbi:START domain-containing protein [Acrasis kona]|uniref:START domain-containing protein n=1 Tax=Acrasis kona TaxID=1008807 RepID=A0AAW2YSV6_9EUKA